MLIHAFAAQVIDGVTDRTAPGGRSRPTLFAAAREGPRGGPTGRLMTLEVRAGRFDVDARARRLPDPVADGPRQAAGLSRQRRDDAEAARRARTRSRRTTPGQRQHPPRRPQAEPAGAPTPTRRRASACAQFLNAASTREIVFTRNAPKASTWSRTPSRRRALQAGDEIIDLRDGAPLQHRPLADGLRGDGRAAARGADQRRGELRARRIRAAAHAADAGSSSITHMSNALGTITPVREIVRSRTPRACRCWSTRAGGVPHAGRRAGARLRLPSRPATSSTGRPASACSTARKRCSRRCRRTGRRRHDPLRHLREDHLQRPAVQVRGRHARHRRRDRAGRGDRLHRGHRPRGDRRARARPAGLRHRRAARRSTACG